MSDTQSTPTTVNNSVVTPTSEIWNAQDSTETLDENIEGLDGGQGKSEEPVGNPAGLTKEDRRLLKLTVDGKEEELDEAEVIKRAQKASAADKRFQEAAELRKQSEQLLTMLKQNPFEVLTALGLDPTEMARDHLTKELQMMRMTPEERELHELRTEKQRTEEEARLAREEAEAREAQEYQDRLAGEMQDQIIGALESVNLPRDESSVKEMVEIMRHAITKDLDITWTEAAEMVKEYHKRNYAHFFAQLNEEELASFLGEDTVKKLVKRSTKNLYREEPPSEQPKKVGAKPHRGYRNTVWDE